MKTRKARVAAALIGIECGPQGIALAQVERREDGSPLLQRCAFRAVPPAEQEAALKALVQEHGLQDMPVNLLLHPADYQAHLLDAPEVAADELRDALRWKVRELVGNSLTDYVVDGFNLPEDAYRGRARRSFCAVLDKARMQAGERLVRQAGLRLQSIDITEMAFRNLGLLAGAEGINLGLLRLRSSEGLICIQNGSELYMSRRIEQGLDQAGEDFANVILEVQRSLDYYEGQLGKGYIARLLLLPMKRLGEPTLAALSSGLAVHVLPLRLAELFPGQPAAELDDAAQAFCIGAVGAALRQEAG